MLVIKWNIQIIKNLNLDVLSTQCGPNGTATSHAECKSNRPWHPAEPDLKGLPDLITDARTVQVWLFLNNYSIALWFFILKPCSLKISLGRDVIVSIPPTLREVFFIKKLSSLASVELMLNFNLFISSILELFVSLLLKTFAEWWDYQMFNRLKRLNLIQDVFCMTSELFFKQISHSWALTWKCCRWKNSAVLWKKVVLANRPIAPQEIPPKISDAYSGDFS